MKAEPNCAEARFNLALSLEHLFLFEAAAIEWRRYLALDADSPWSVQAQKHLVALETSQEELRLSVKHPKPVSPEIEARGDPQGAREGIENNLLPAWAEAMSGGHEPAATRALTRALELSNALTMAGRDPLARDMVTTIAEAQDSKNARALRDLSLGHRLLAIGRADLSAHRVERASRELDTALAALRRAGSHAALLARMNRAIVFYQRNKAGAARSQLRALLHDPNLTNYSSLRARIEWMIGLAELRLDGPGAAVSAYERALNLFRSQGEEASCVAIEGLLAEALDLSGRPNEAWDHRYRALAWSSHQRAATRVYNILDDTVQSLVLGGRTELSLPFQDRLISVATALHQDAELVMSLLRRSRILHRLDRDVEARASLRQATLLLEGVRDPPTYRRLAAEVYVVRGEVATATELDIAIASLGHAIGFRSQPELLRTRANLYTRKGVRAAATRDLFAALDAFERQRRSFRPGTDQISFFDGVASASSTLVSLQLRSGLSDQAFFTTERARARTLLDRMSSKPITSQERIRKLPQQTLLVEYDIVDGNLVTWLADSSGLQPALVGPRFESIARLVNGLRVALVQHNWPRTRNHLCWLHEVLVAPWSSILRTDCAIVFSPTGALNGLAFPALIDPKTSRFLLQDHAVSITPSATAYLASLARAANRAHAPLRTALVVGDPSLSRNDRSLPPLPGAAREATVIASLYPNAELLLQSIATRQHVMTSAAASDLIHIAAHAETSQDALGSHLLLTPDGADHGMLFASEIFGASLPRTRIVVLAGCATAKGQVSQTEGALSLAYAFQAAGVPTVVATLWNIRDHQSTALFVPFHHLLRDGMSPSFALRRVQLEYLKHNPDQPWEWAGLELIGANLTTDPSGHQNLQPHS